MTGALSPCLEAVILASSKLTGTLELGPSRGAQGLRDQAESHKGPFSRPCSRLCEARPNPSLTPGLPHCTQAPSCPSLPAKPVTAHVSSRVPRGLGGPTFSCQARGAKALKLQA